ncbi:MAG TPA: methionine gamma-lyase family protein [Clostridia bacterium]|nr:methionine gamma-lyase family protein [Clostridia bacterium]
MIEMSDRARELVWSAERTLQEMFRRVDAVEMVNQQRVLEAFWEERVSARHFAPTTGYGYDDIGRDTLDRVFAHALMAEKALVRPQFVNGTHAIFTALAGLVEPGDGILSITGEPYDTLLEAIGVRGDAPNSLKRLGVSFSSIELAKKGKIDLDAIRACQGANVKIVYAQRSRGYAWREAITMVQFKEAFDVVREKFPNAIILVDNCYGEFVETTEPLAQGADVIAGSLIKNPGGGLAPTGGYIAGREAWIDRISQRMTVPGMGAEVGSYAGDYRLFYQGLFLAPHVTAQCVKGAMLFAKAFEQLNLLTMPVYDATRSDIIQAVQFPDAESLVAFCRSIQKAAPVDSFVSPEPWDMPGYEDQVVMAAGAFVQGATTELSADGPIRAPYTAYLQGSLTYAHARIACMMACDELIRQGF